MFSLMSASLLFALVLPVPICFSYLLYIYIFISCVLIFVSVLRVCSIIVVAHSFIQMQLISFPGQPLYLSARYIGLEYHEREFYCSQSSLMVKTVGRMI